MTMSTSLDSRGVRTSNEVAPALIVSSDGHAVAPMKEYRQYLPSSTHEEFDAFCEAYERDGLRVVQPESLLQRTDQDVVDQWIETVFKPGRHEGQGNSERRLAELDREGVAAEVLFPDFGLPFELHPPLIAAIRGWSRPPEQVELANAAHNRWLADFCATAPARFAGLAVASFVDVDATLAEIGWAKEAGLKGVVLPAFSEDLPLFHERFEPVWSLLEELEMPVNSHTAISSITTHVASGTLKAVPHPACAAPLMTAQAFFFCQQILGHFIWGGVLERHPKLQVVLTEQGSGWVIGAMRGMDYSWENSYLRRDVRQVVPRKPSEYFHRQVSLGSSLLSRAEAEARREIGVDKMALGVDYPHHEGTWGAGPGTSAWIQATLGAARVPEDEARMILGENAIRVWQLDEPALRDVADRVGPAMSEILTPPSVDHFPRGDINKPLTSAW
jgi:predicted TIM-barrel fold metal-dependent hydrolase